MYAPLVRQGGLIGFHDIVPGRQELIGVVPEFWQSLKVTERYKEIVEDWQQGGWGIGLIFKEEAVYTNKNSGAQSKKRLGGSAFC